MAFFSESGLVASRKLRLCEKDGTRLDYIEGRGFCCPKCQTCWWPQGEPPVQEVNKARCYQKGQMVPKSQSSGRKRKKPPKKQDFSDLYGDS